MCRTSRNITARGRGRIVGNTDISTRFHETSVLPVTHPESLFAASGKLPWGTGAPIRVHIRSRRFLIGSSALPPTHQMRNEAIQNRIQEDAQENGPPP
jgi:hypothetical protein